MDIGFVIYGGLDHQSGGYRYDRKLVEYLRNQGDRVELIRLSRRTYSRHLTDSLSQSLQNRLDRPFDVLLQDELCHPSLWRHNPHLTRPSTIVTLVHLLRSDGPPRQLGPVPGRVERRVSRTVERAYLQSVDGAVCTSQQTEQGVQALAEVPSLVAYPAGRNEGPAVEYSHVQDRAQWDPFRILFVGNVVPRKGVTTLLAALEQLEGPWEATIVGNLDAQPTYAQTVKRRIRQRDYDGTVRLTGSLPAAALAVQFERSHALAVPSTYEGFGMVYLEAMEYGVVPIATTDGGAGEFISDGTNGVLVEPDSPRQLRDTLASYRADRESLAACGVAALEIAATHPTWESSMAAIREFLLQLAEDQT